MSSWVSCQKIVFNLHKAYQQNSEFELLNFNYSADQTNDDLRKTAHEIAAVQPSVVIVMDHKPHPLKLLQLLLPLLDNKKTKILFHVFGDFTLHYQKWADLAQFLKEFSVEFVVASDRQKILIDKLLPQSHQSSICPFPVDESEFNLNFKSREKQRSDWGLAEKDVAFLFTGRLSRQKRTLTLLRTFADFLDQSNAQNAHLFIYGTPDSVGDLFLGKWEIDGEYFRRLNRYYKSLPEKIQSKIHFMGSVPNAELVPVYQGADYLVNLSVHNDEDFGMSVAEAQCSGLSSIVTDWGGLASFWHQELPSATKFIPVKIGTRIKRINYQSVVKALLDSYSEGNVLPRSEISKIALNKFGTKACGKIIGEIINREFHKFSKFSELFDDVIVAEKVSPQPYITESKTINKLYRELYSSYVRTN